MTLLELFNDSAKRLKFTEAGEFETKVLFEDILKITVPSFNYSKVNATDEQISIMANLIERRVSGEPLQYIVGNWDFYGFNFLVGEGVLIPRPETEMLVEHVLEQIKNVNNPVVFDLCSGSGCIGLTIAKLKPDAKVYLFEKEDKAFEFTQKNAQNLSVKNATLIKCDILSFDVSALSMADVIVSNPPYIKTDEISSLQAEVQNEPIAALDGGKDGLIFYRCIAAKWVSKIKNNGILAMECGDGQSSEIVEIFDSIVSNSNVIFDFNDIDRIVTFRI